MANMLIPAEERNLTPEEVEALDRRRRRGQLFLVICFQCIIVGTLVTLWAGQDLTYSPGWARPMFYWDAILFTLAAIFGVAGIRLRRGSNDSSATKLHSPNGLPLRGCYQPCTGRQSDSKSQTSLSVAFVTPSGIIPV